MPDDQESENRAREENEEERRRHRGDDDGDQREEAVAGGHEGTAGREDEMVDSGGEEEQDAVEYTPDAVDIPYVELEDNEAVTGIEIDTSEPDVAQTPEREVRIPDMELATPEADTADIEIETTEPEIEVVSEEQNVPVVQLDAVSEVRMQVTSFDTEIRRSDRRRRQRVHVPLYRAISKPRVQFVPELQQEIEEEIRRRIEQLKDVPSESSIAEDVEGQGEATEDSEQDDDVDAETGGDTAAGSGIPAGGSAGEDIPDFMEFIFEGAGGGGELQTEGTKIVLFNEAEENSYVGSFVTLCRRIYREKHGGNPEFQPINQIDDINKREIEKWLEADKKVILIDLDAREKQVREEKLKEKLEATLGEFGFIIFKATDEDILREYREKLERIYLESPHPLLNIVRVDPKHSGFSVERRITELSWGNIDLQFEAGFAAQQSDLDRSTGSGIFDDLFNRWAQERFEEQLEAVKSEENGLFKRVTTENGGQIEGKEIDDHRNGESPLHYNIKVYLVRYLVRKLREQGEDLNRLHEVEQRVVTEEPYDDVIPDVRLPNENEVYEVETLFRTGQDPTKKIDRTIGKYQNSSVNKIHIVIENFTFLRHLKELAQIKQHYSHLTNQQGEELVEFKTLDLRNDALLSLNKIIESLRSLEDDEFDG